MKSVIMLCVIMLSDLMMSVITLSVIKLCVIMLSIFMLIVIILSAILDFYYAECCYDERRYAECQYAECHGASLFHFVLYEHKKIFSCSKKNFSTYAQCHKTFLPLCSGIISKGAGECNTLASKSNVCRFDVCSHH